jgi:hypothetical protein
VKPTTELARMRSIDKARGSEPFGPGMASASKTSNFLDKASSGRVQPRFICPKYGGGSRTCTSGTEGLPVLVLRPGVRL